MAGYAGKILMVDVMGRRAKGEKTDMAVAREHLRGEE